MNNELLKAKINDIENMTNEQLQEFGVVVDTSFLDGKYKIYIYEAIEKRELQLQKQREFGYLAEEGECKADEFKV